MIPVFLLPCSFFFFNQVNAVRKLYPNPIAVEIDVGKLIAQALQTARAESDKKNGGGSGGRRLTGDSSKEGGSWIDDRGNFNLGHIPPSDRKNGGFEGSGTPCGWECGTFRADGEFDVLWC